MDNIYEHICQKGSAPELEARHQTQVNRGSVVTVTRILLLAGIALLGLAKTF